MKRPFLSAHFNPFDHVKTTLLSLFAGLAASSAAFLWTLGADVERPNSFYYGIIPLVHHLQYDPHQPKYMFFMASGGVQVLLMISRLVIALIIGISLTVPFFGIFRLMAISWHFASYGPEAPALKVPAKLPDLPSV